MAAAVPFIIAGASAYGAIQQGNQNRAALQQQADQAQRDRDAQINQARVARQQAGADEEAQRREARQLLATQRAAIGQAGIGTGGTPGLLMEDSEMQAELDALNIRYGGEQQAANLLNQANESGISSKILRGNASQAARSGYLKAGAGLLSSGASMYAKSRGSGINNQGQNAALTNNAAFVKNM